MCSARASRVAAATETLPKAKSGQIIFGADYVIRTRYNITMYKCLCFFTFARCSPAPVGRFSRSRLRGTQGARLYSLSPGGLRGVCSARSKSRNLASSRGVAFRGARAEQDNGKPTCQLFCATPVKGSNTVATIA